MVELAIQMFHICWIETIEMDRGGTSYTYDTMEILAKREPDANFISLSVEIRSSICRNGII